MLLLILQLSICYADGGRKSYAHVKKRYLWTFTKSN